MSVAASQRAGLRNRPTLPSSSEDLGGLSGNRPGSSITGPGNVIFAEEGRHHRLPRWQDHGYAGDHGSAHGARLLISHHGFYHTREFDAGSGTDLQNPDDRWDRLSTAVAKSIVETPPGASMERRFHVGALEMSTRVGQRSGGAYEMLATEQLTEWSRVPRLDSALAQAVHPETPASGVEIKAQVLGAIDRLRESVRLGVASAVAETGSPESLERALVDAEQFVNAWPGTPIAKPDVGLADDGEVNFDWKHAGAHVDLGFFGDGTYSYFAKDDRGERYFGDDVPAGDGLAGELLQILVEQA